MCSYLNVFFIFPVYCLPYIARCIYVFICNRLFTYIYLRSVPSFSCCVFTFGPNSAIFLEGIPYSGSSKSTSHLGIVCPSVQSCCPPPPPAHPPPPVLYVRLESRPLTVQSFHKSSWLLPIFRAYYGLPNSKQRREVTSHG